MASFTDSEIAMMVTSTGMEIHYKDGVYHSHQKWKKD